MSKLNRAALPLAIYYRVSTGKQAKKKGWREAQLRPIHRMFEKFGWAHPPDDLYFKDAASAFRGGGVAKRSDFQRMIELARAGVIRGFVVHTPDRYFRNAFNSFASYPELRDAGVEGWVADPDGAWNMFAPEHEERFMREMVDSHNYSRRISRHVTKGKNRVAEAGLFNGPRLPRGWTKNADGEAVHTDEMPLIIAGAERYLSGDLSLRLLAGEMRLRGIDIQPVQWGHIFGNPFYAGLVTKPNDTGRVRKNRRGVIDLNDYHAGQHASRAAWSVETMQRLCAIMAEHRIGGRSAHPTAREYVFGGHLLRCSYCGRGLTGRSDSRASRRRRYMCLSVGIGLSCEARSRSITQSVLSEQIGDVLKNFAIPDDWPERLAEIGAQAAPPAHGVAMRRIREAREAAYRDISAKRITPTEFIARIEAIDAEEANITVSRRPTIASTAELAEALRDVASAWGRASDMRRRNLAHMMFGLIEVDIPHKQVRAFELTPAVGDLFVVSPSRAGSPITLAQDAENRRRFVMQWTIPDIQ